MTRGARTPSDGHRLIATIVLSLLFILIALLALLHGAGVIHDRPDDENEIRTDAAATSSGHEGAR